MSEQALRLFVALELPEEVRAELVRWRTETVGRLDGLRALDSADLHVTLCFLGYHPEGSVPEIAAACERARSLPAAALAIGEAVWLPPRSPRVLAVGFADAGERLSAVQATLSQALAEGEFYRPEARPFLAHTTVARVRRGARMRAIDLPPPAPLAFPGRRVTLYRSRLARAGAHYEALAAVELAEST